MGNCQAIDTATIVIQHPSGKIDKFYSPLPASQIIKLNPGYYVALLITTITTTTVCHTNNSSSNNSSTNSNTSKTYKNESRKISDIKGVGTNKSTSKSDTDTDTNTGTSRNSVRITRVKLLKPTDMLVLGHVYRLINTKEVMKGLVAKKQAKLKKDGIELTDSEALKEAENLAKKSHIDKIHLVSRQGQGHRCKRGTSTNGGSTKSRTYWQPTLHSISESTS